MAAVKGAKTNLYKKRIEPFLDTIADLKKSGKSDDYISKLLGISRKSFFTHKSKVDEFYTLYNESKNTLINQLETTLYDLALGRAKKRTVTVKKTPSGEYDSEEEKIEYLPPDKISLFFALTNLAGDKWQHKREIMNTNEDAIEAIKELSNTINESK